MSNYVESAKLRLSIHVIQYMQTPDPFAHTLHVIDIDLLIPGPEVIKLFSCSTQLSTKFQLLIKTKIPKSEEVSCFKSLRCCIHLANKC